MGASDRSSRDGPDVDGADVFTPVLLFILHLVSDRNRTKIREFERIFIKVEFAPVLLQNAPISSAFYQYPH
jgi:hypothetical protein